MADLGAYLTHAKTYGSLRDVWETAWDDLDAIEVGELALALRALASKKRPFSLSREESDRLIRAPDRGRRRRRGRMPHGRRIEVQGHRVP